jgi:hypothetical protein
MFPQNQASDCCNFVISNWLLDIGASPLSHSPSYSGGYSAGYPESNLGDCPAGYPAGNPENYLDRYSVSYSAGYPEENSASYLENCGDCCSPSCSADCPENS